MAYQNVGTPRFFIDNYQYLRAIGLDTQAYIDETSDVNDFQLGSVENYYSTPLSVPEWFTLDPSVSTESPMVGITNGVGMFIPSGNISGESHSSNLGGDPYNIIGLDFSGNMKLYFAVLNHNISTLGVFRVGFSGHIGDANHLADFDFQDILNTKNGTSGDVLYGSSIGYTDQVPDSYYLSSGSPSYMGDPRYLYLQIIHQVSEVSPARIGAISMGIMYTMPYSVDLNLTMNVEFDGYDEVETLGGSTLTNIRHTGAPVWSNMGYIGDGAGNFTNFYTNPFEITTPYDENIETTSSMKNKSLDGARRNGRRSWNLKFSHISDKDLFSSNYMNTSHAQTIEDYDSDDINAINQFNYNMLTDDSFMAQVWNKTLGGALPFIFQPDSNNNNPDQFCIAKFDMKSLNIKQIAFKTYEISVKIREVW